MPREAKKKPTVEELTDAAISEIGIDGVVIVRPDGTVEAHDLKLRRKRAKVTKASIRKPPPKRANDELVEGYRKAAELAEVRMRQSADMQKSGEEEAWRKLAEYCTAMADGGYVDDDYVMATDGRERYRLSVERVLDKELMTVAEALGNVSELVPTENIGIPEWKWAAMELALNHLSPLQRVCFEMHVAGRLTYDDIGQALEMTRSEVTMHMSRARRTLTTKVRPLFDHIFQRKSES